MRYIGRVIRVAKEAHAPRGFEHAFFDRVTLAAIHRPVDDSELGNFGGYTLHDFAAIV
jgi:hypothetical protein